MSQESAENLEVNEPVENQEAEVHEINENQEAEQEIVEGQEVEGEESSEDESGEVHAETQEEFEQEVADAIEDGASEEEVRSMVKKFQLKVNGKVVDKEIDLNDEDAVKRELQKAAAFNQTAQEAAQLKKMYEQEIQRLQSNPWEVLQELGLNPDELNESYLEERINEMKKTPEQVEQEKMQKELSQARERLKEMERKEEEAKEAESLAQAEAELESEIMEALDSHKTLPPTQKTMSRIADALMYAMDYADENGYDSSKISVADVIPYVEQDYRNEMRSLLDNAPEQMLEEYVGKQNLERLRKNRVASAKKNPKQVVKPTAKSVESKEKPKEKMSVSDYFRELQKVK